jgi:hypothetical protein
MAWAFDPQFSLVGRHGVDFASPRHPFLGPGKRRVGHRHWRVARRNSRERAGDAPVFARPVSTEGVQVVVPDTEPHIGLPHPQAALLKLRARVLDQLGRPILGPVPGEASARS